MTVRIFLPSKHLTLIKPGLQSVTCLQRHKHRHGTGQNYKALTHKQTNAKPKHTKAAACNGQKDKGWNDAGIARFAELLETVKTQRSKQEREKLEEKLLETLQQSEVHRKKLKKRKKPVLENARPTTRPALTCYDEGDNVVESVASVISL